MKEPKIGVVNFQIKKEMTQKVIYFKCNDSQNSDIKRDKCYILVQCEELASVINCDYSKKLVN